MSVSSRHGYDSLKIQFAEDRRIVVAHVSDDFSVAERFGCALR
jgi:hypothetical protein